MKRAFLGIISLLLITSCASVKKNETREEKSASSVEVNADSIAKLKEQLKTANKTIEELKTKKTTTEIKYKPEIDPATGKAKPFNYETKENGKPKTSVHVDGNGEVTIRSEEEETQQIREQYSDSIRDITHEFNRRLQAQASTIQSLESHKSKTGGGSFWLWFWIILLAILLAVSIYFHVVRTGIPFLNKK